MKHPLLFLAGILTLAVSCALPLDTSAPTDRSGPGTASVVLSLPAASRAVGSLTGHQATIEPQNLASLFDHVQVELNSLSQPSVTKTVPVSQAARIRIDGLVEASDWTLTVTALDSSNVPVASSVSDAGGLSTTKGQETVWPDVNLRPVPGTGVGSFRLDLTDFPTEVSEFTSTLELIHLQPDASLGVASTELNKLITEWSAGSLVVRTLDGQSIASGSYQLTLRPRRANGSALTFQPTFTLNVYPDLASTLTFSVAAWDNAPPPTALNSVTWSTSNTGLVLKWQPVDPRGVSGYEWAWMRPELAAPGSGSLELLSALRKGFAPSSGMASLLQPSLVLDATTLSDSLAIQNGWVFYVRSVQDTGARGAWSSIAVDVQSLQFSVAIQSLRFYGGEPGQYRLVRVNGPVTDGSDVPLSTLDVKSPLGALAFTMPGLPSGTGELRTLAEPWILAPQQELLLQTPSGYRILSAAVNRSVPGQPAFALHVYEAFNDNLTQPFPYFVGLPAPLPAMADFGPQWQMQIWSPDTVEVMVAGSAADGFEGRDKFYDVTPVFYNQALAQWVPGTSLLSANPDQWNTVSVTLDSDQTRSMVVRAYYWDTPSRTGYFGPWNQRVSVPQTEVNAPDVWYDASTETLHWSAPSTAAWPSASAIAGYDLVFTDSNGNSYPEASVGSGVTSYATSGPGVFTVKTRFLKADGATEATSAGEVWPKSLSAPNSVLADAVGRHQDTELDWNASTASGRFETLRRDTSGSGWFVGGRSGYGDREHVWKLLPSGAVDASFSSAGYFNTGNTTYFGEAPGLVQNPSNHDLLVTSYANNGLGYVFLQRLAADGTQLDAGGAWQGSGGVDRDSRGQPFYLPSHDRVYQLVWDGGFDGGSSDWGLVRGNFDYTGQETAWFGETSPHVSIAFDSVERIYTTREAGGVDRYTWPQPGALGIDASWGGSGNVTVTLGGNVITVTAMAVDTNDKVVVVGTYGGSGFVARYNTDGTLDSGFNAGGTPGYWEMMGIFPTAVAVSSNNDVAVVGNDSPAGDYNGQGYLRVYDASGLGKIAYSQKLDFGLHGAAVKALAFGGNHLMLSGYYWKSTTLTAPIVWRF